MGDISAWGAFSLGSTGRGRYGHLNNWCAPPSCGKLLPITPPIMSWGTHAWLQAAGGRGKGYLKDMELRQPTSCRVLPSWKGATQGWLGHMFAGQLPCPALDSEPAYLYLLGSAAQPPRLRPATARHAKVQPSLVELVVEALKVREVSESPFPHAHPGAQRVPHVHGAWRLIFLFLGSGAPCPASQRFGSL